MRAYDVLFRQAFTRVDAETAHHAGFRAIRAARPVLARAGVPGSPVEAMGLTFPNALGLAAGFDKNAVGIDALAALGFGHVEIGTVTGEPQPGNDKPRLFRLPEDRAILNRMGFNNDGAEAVAERLRGRKAQLEGRQGATRGALRPNSTVLGINIGKSKVVPEDDQDAVVGDYERSATLLAPYADYLVVNVSSPNTPGLRNLQAVEKLEPILSRVLDVAGDVPLLVKIAPDLSDDDVLAVGDLTLSLRLAGIIATNTTISRDGLVTDSGTVESLGAGGLSGAPLTERSCAVMRLLRERVGPDLCLIGVGGISTAEDARQRMDAGATLVQAYTGFVYGGPAWPRRIARALA